MCCGATNLIMLTKITTTTTTITTTTTTTMQTPLKSLLISSVVISGLVASSQASVILSDDFSSNTASASGTSFQQQHLGDALWHHGGAWSVSSGALQATGDTNVATDSEGAIIQAKAVGSATGTTLQLTFDYTLAAAGESLSVFLYGTKIESGFPDNATGRMANLGHVAADGSGRMQYLELDANASLVSSVEFVGGNTLSESAPTGYLGQTPGTQYSYFAKITGVTNSGTFDQSVDLSQWGLAVEDFTYINVGFARDAVTGSNVTIDNVNLTAVPEPSSAALLGLGGLSLIMRRRR